MKIVIKTLVDVTRTDVRRKGQGDTSKLLQQKNYETLLQVINLRSLIDANSDPSVETRDITKEKFGSRYKGEHRVWTYEFTIDRDEVFLDGDDPIGLLKEDFRSVPVLGGLSETISKPTAFDLDNGASRNTIIETVDK